MVHDQCRERRGAEILCHKQEAASLRLGYLLEQRPHVVQRLHRPGEQRNIAIVQNGARWPQQLLALERPKGGSFESRKIVFSPPPGKDLVIDIKNMEVNQLIGFDMAYGIPQATADFEVYTDLLLNPAMGTALIRNTIGGSAGVGLSHCPPSGG